MGLKVVLFCGGLGMRMRPLSGEGGDPEDALPKPMIRVGGEHPLMWHVMKYYAHHGHNDFVLCLGYKARTVKDYFLNYNEFLSNDFTFEKGGRDLDLHHSDIEDWRISFVDTGLRSNVGQRLMKVKDYVKDEEVFLCNYSDGLSDLPLDPYLDQFLKSDKVGAFVCVRPPQTSHVVRVDADGTVRGIDHITQAGVWINGGYFIFRPEVFEYMSEGEELVVEPFKRMIDAGKLMGYHYEGFWTCIDTFKEKQQLDDRFASGDTPWQLWRQPV